jgi:hypothetical protein
MMRRVPLLLVLLRLLLAGCAGSGSATRPQAAPVVAPAASEPPASVEPQVPAPGTPAEIEEYAVWSAVLAEIARSSAAEGAPVATVVVRDRIGSSLPVDFGTYLKPLERTATSGRQYISLDPMDGLESAGVHHSVTRTRPLILAGDLCARL